MLLILLKHALFANYYCKFDIDKTLNMNQRNFPFLSKSNAFISESSQWPSGIYVLKLVASDGKNYVRKIVKQ